MQKSALLYLHNTIYGDIATALPFVDMPGKSASICVRSSQVDWRNNLFSRAAAAQLSVGMLTSNAAPIAVVNWTAGGGHCVVDGMEWWSQCMTMFMRHV